MNANTLAKMLGMNVENTSKLNQAWEQAQEMSQGVTSLEGARKVIEAVGMTNEAITKAGNLLNSPVASIVASAIGADIGKARRAINALMGNSQPSPPQNHKSESFSSDDISRLKAGLRQLRC